MHEPPSQFEVSLLVGIVHHWIKDVFLSWVLDLFTWIDEVLSFHLKYMATCPSCGVLSVTRVGQVWQRFGQVGGGGSSPLSVGHRGGRVAIIWPTMLLHGFGHYLPLLSILTSFCYILSLESKYFNTTDGTHLVVKLFTLSSSFTHPYG
jgi:hypothetical protein